MERLAMQDLERWHLSPRRKPLLLQGARQVGKTWLMREFGKRAFANVAYVNFLEDENMTNVFEGSLSPDRLLDAVRLQTGVEAGSPDILVVFDEIQECPRALTSMKAFAEQAPEVPLIAAGSLLGVALHQGASFPVGKVDHLFLHPMTFKEFLFASGEDAMADALNAADEGLMDAFSERFTEQLKRYYFVGGMPEAVLAWVERKDYQEVRSIQERLLFDYEHDFSKYATPDLTEKLRLVWGSVPAQLARENKTFIYSAVKSGARARGYEEAIQWLCDAGLLIKVNRVSKGGLPLAAYEDKDAFKLYFLDVGLLGAASRLVPGTLIEGNALFAEFKGALTENYVCQELTAKGSVRPYYWSADRSSAEVDFVYDYDGAIVPVEVKAETNLRAKSLRLFVERNGLERGVRLSLAGFQRQDWVVNIPLYAASLLPQQLKAVVEKA